MFQCGLGKIADHGGRVTDGSKDPIGMNRIVKNIGKLLEPRSLDQEHRKGLFVAEHEI